MRKSKRLLGFREHNLIGILQIRDVCKPLQCYPLFNCVRFFKILAVVSFTGTVY